MINKLLCRLNPFDGINHHSIIIMDNDSVQHVQETVDMLEEFGVLMYFIPPYSPDCNPIEELFSMLKSVLKANEYLSESFDTLLM